MRAANLGVADWLHLAATPTFALMALLTAMPEDDAYRATCLGLSGGSTLGGMGVMYLLMSIFHAAPWVRLAWRWGERSG